MAGPVRVLLVEDSKLDAELVLAELKRAGLEFESWRVSSEKGLREGLTQLRPQVVITDYSMPGFDGFEALAICREQAPDIPCIFMSGTIGENFAVKAMKAGASDYVMKTNLLRLGPAVKRELRAAEWREKHGIGEVALRRAQSMAMLGHVVANADGSIESWSDNLPQLLGADAAAAVPKSGRAWLQLVHPEDRSLYRGTMVEAGRRGERMQVEYRLRRRDGAWAHILQVMEPLGRAAGKTRWFNTLQDITAQKQAAAELRASEERYRATFEQAAVGVVHTALEGDILLANPVFCALVGYTRAEAVQLNIRDITNAEDIARSVEGRARMLKNNAPYERELRLVRKDRSEVWVSITTSLVRDPQGKPRHFISVVHDITERKRAEADLHRFRAAMDITIDSIYLTDVETKRLLYVNETACRRLGYSREELLKKTTYDLIGKSRDEIKREYDEVIAAGDKGTSSESRFVRKDGSEGWTELHRRAVRIDGAMMVVTIGRDISERKQAALALAGSEARKSAILEASLDAIVSIDHLGRIVEFNPAAERCFGYTRAQAVGASMSELIVPPELRARHREGFQRYLATGEAKILGSRIEIPALRADGSRFDAELTISLIAGSEPPAFTGTVRDVTERKRAELALAESEQRFRSLSELSTDWFWQTDAEHRFMSTPTRVTQITGLRGNAYIGKARWEVPGLVPVSGDWSEHRGVLERRESYRDLELVQTRPDGTRAYLQVSGEPVYDAEGKFAGYRGTAKDISAGKRAEEDLRRFRLAMDGSADIILLVDRATMLNVDCNATACRLLGYSREELLRLGPADILPVGRDELEKAYDELIVSPAAAFGGMRSHYRCKDGSLLPFESTRRVLRSGDSWLIVVISRDVRERIAADAALRASEERFRSLTALSSDFYWETDAGHRVARTEHGGDRTHPVVDPGQIGKARWETPSTYPDAAGWRKHRAAMDAHQPFRDFEVARIGKDGVERWRSLSGEPVFDASGAFKGYRGVGKDITERKVQQKRIERLSRVHALLSGINAAIVRIRDRKELYREACRVALEEGGFSMAWIGVVHRAAGRIEPVAWLGTDAAYIGAMPLELDEAASGKVSLAGRAVREGKAVVSDDLAGDPRVVLRDEAAARNYHSLAILPLAEGGEVSGVLALYAAEVGFFDAQEMKLLNELAGDISFALEVISKDEKLNYLALHDALTGLANRALFVERLGQSMQESGRQGAKFALAWLDLERLTTINESLGRQAGDSLLKQVGERLAQAADAGNVARIAADNFIALLPQVKGRSQVSRAVTELLRACFAAPYVLEGNEVQVAGKAGLALFPNDGSDAEMLLRNAEAAHRKAKESGERYVFFTPGLIERSGETLTLENKLRRALENEEFVLHYQPKVDLESRKIVGVEALIRWQSPELGLVPPMKFIPLMEQTGMILDAGTWALKRASLDHRKWTEAGLKPPRVAVNVSAIQLRQRDFVSAVEQAILEGVAPTGIDLEITESLVMEDIEGNIGKLREVRKLGAALAIDDFGTGYSSLSYLAKLPVQTLKIDRSFIITMLREPDTMTLVQTIISLAHSLRLKVVAEGVDSEDQAKVLRLLRCDEMQGFLFSKPLPLEQMTALLLGSPSQA